MFQFRGERWTDSGGRDSLAHRSRESLPPEKKVLRNLSPLKSEVEILSPPKDKK